MTSVDAGVDLVLPRPGAPIGAPRRAFLLPAHGGSGATTLARALRLPEATSLEGANAVIVTALTTAGGAEALLPRVGRLDVSLPVTVVWTADAPLPPAPRVRAVQRLLADRAVFVTLPYVPAWRYGRPSASSATPRWLRAVREVAVAARLPLPLPHQQSA